MLWPGSLGGSEQDVVARITRKLRTKYFLLSSGVTDAKHARSIYTRVVSKMHVLGLHVRS